MGRKLLASEKEINFFNRNVIFENSRILGSKQRIRGQIYENFNRKARSMTNNICITVFVISPVSYVVPIVMKSYYDYFVLNTSSDAFLLFYPTKWVLIVFFYGMFLSDMKFGVGKSRWNFHFFGQAGAFLFFKTTICGYFEYYSLENVQIFADVSGYRRLFVDICGNSKLNG